MPKSRKDNGEGQVERRKHWRDRRKGAERRSAERLRHMDGDCRDSVPRRDSDLAGKLDEGELWWSGDRKYVS